MEYPVSFYVLSKDIYTFTHVLYFHKDYIQRSCPGDYIRHTPCIHRHTGLSMASLNVLVKLLPSSPFAFSLFSLLTFAASFLPPVFISIFLNFLGYALGKYLVVQPRFWVATCSTFGPVTYIFKVSIFCTFSFLFAVFS